MKKVVCAILCVALLASLAACSATNAQASSAAPVSASQSAVASTAQPTAAASVPASASASAQTSSQVSSITTKQGPNGEVATPASDVKITDEQKQKIRDGHYKAAIVLHYAGNDWSTAMVNGAKAAFKDLGVEVVAVTDANFKAEKQASDVESVMALKPNMIVAMVVDAVSDAPAFQKAAGAGIALSFMSNEPKGMVAGKDYGSVITSDDMGNGITAADIMGEKLGGKGNVGMLYYDADFYTTNQRDKGFEQEMAAKYPNIKIIGKAGFTDGNNTSDVAAAFFTKYPNLDGVYTSWDLPADGVMAAARTAGLNKLVVTCVDLGTNAARNIAEGGMIAGLGAQRPYDMGYLGAVTDALRLLGETPPAYVVCPALPVTHDNVLDAWKQVYYTDAPKEVQDAFKK